MSRNILSCSKGVKDPFEVQNGMCNFLQSTVGGKGLISPGGVYLLFFLELRQVLSTYDRDLRDPSGGLRKGQSPCQLLGGLSGYLFRRYRGLSPCVDSVPEPENSCPVLTWTLGYF